MLRITPGNTSHLSLGLRTTPVPRLLRSCPHLVYAAPSRQDHSITAASGDSPLRAFEATKRVRTQSASVHQTAPPTNPGRRRDILEQPTAPPDNDMESSSRTHRILSQPSIEGEPLKFLKLSEAFWKVSIVACICWRPAAPSCKL